MATCGCESIRSKHRKGSMTLLSGMPFFSAFCANAAASRSESATATQAAFSRSRSAARVW